MPPPSKPQPSSTSDDTLLNPKDDICPVCKSSRYFNPAMQLLVSPDCYHRMCASCVSRIFAHGPAQCPIAGCKRTLRRHRFRTQTFEDMRVEREVDVRREVAAAMNRAEDDFEDLNAYNDYLELVESVTFNLLNGIDVPATRAALESYRAEHASAVAGATQRARDDAVHAHARAAADREAGGVRRRAAGREAVEEREARMRANDAEVDRLARGGDADGASTPASGGATGAFVIRGLKKRVPPSVSAGDGHNADGSLKAYSPFAGVHYALRHAHQRPGAAALADWRIGWLDSVRRDERVTAGGYDVSAYTSRALLDAFAGLGVMVGEETAGRESVGSASGQTGAPMAAAAAPATVGRADNGDDVF